MLSKGLPSIVASAQKVKLPTGKVVPVIRLNNAATAPPFEFTLREVNNFLQTYGALHRGAGPNATITYQKVESAIATIRKFLNTPTTHTLLFTQNTSDAINLFARLLKLQKEDVVITSSIEHTSNNLPWKYNTVAKVVYINAFPDGSIDYSDLEKKVEKYQNKLKLIALTGASNQTGYIPDIQKIAKLAHQHRALLFVDAAQLAPHRQIDIRADHIDALAFSAHKVYAPFGIGVLALPTKLLDTMPVNPGGGSIDMISDKNILWAPITQRHQTGTWNVTGIIALAASCNAIMRTGWKKIETHEKKLLKHALKKMQQIPELTLYVPLKQFLRENRIATIPFNLKGYHHALLASILENEYGIETRAGTICNHKLVRSWFHISDTEQKRIERQIKKGNRLASYGIVRASIGIYNSLKDINALASALQAIAKNGPKLKYRPNPEEETYELI